MSGDIQGTNMDARHRNYTTLIMLSLLLAICVVLGCKDNSPKEVATEITTAADKPSELTTGWPKPDSYAGDIPVYNKFEGLEPLFRFDNDTTYVVNFWATWCKPCIKELPYFEEFNSANSNNKVKVVLVSLDFPKQVESNLVPFVKKKELKSKVVVLLDGKYNDWIDKVSPDWSGAIPATYIYNGEQHQLISEPIENLEELIDIVKPFL